MANNKQGDALRDEALAQIRKASMQEELATISAGPKKGSWPVRIVKQAGEFFNISGRGSCLTVYLHDTNSGYLVSVPSHQRCGHVPGDCNSYDIENYVGLENDIDATTLAVGVRWLIDNGYASKLAENIPTTSIDYCQSCGKDFIPGEVVYFATWDNNIVCDKCGEVHRDKKRRRFAP